MRETVKSHWYAWVALLLVLVENLLLEPHQFVAYHYALAWRDQPLPTALHLAAYLLRATALSLAATSAAEILFHAMPRFFRRAIPVAYRPALFLVAYALYARAVFVDRPAISIFFRIYYPKALFFTALLALVMLRLFRGKRANLLKPNGPPVAAPVLTGALSVLLLFALRGPLPSFSGSPAADARDERPSFLLLSLDGVPADLFAEHDTSRFTAPLWHRRWRPKSLAFDTAYSVTNSTFTSWFSVLSGSYPWRTGVETLYPSRREGGFPLDRLLPEELRRLGYITSFHTDCGATSYMKPEYGFDRLHQRGLGLFGCGDAMLLSRHPLAWAGGLWDAKNTILPDLDSFCSAIYRPRSFFDSVIAELRDLEKTGRPFFLAVHSCATHQLMPHHPAMSSPLRRDLPHGAGAESPRKHNLALSIRYADAEMDRVFSAARGNDRLWSFFFADHGVRIDRDRNGLKLFTHAVGFPVNRFQYRVPLAILPPETAGRESGTDAGLRALTDVNATVRELAGLSGFGDGESLLAPARPGRLITLTSAMPIVLAPDNRDIFDAFWKNTLLPDGGHAFPTTLEEELRAERPIAGLRLPHRLLLLPGQEPRLYDEARDPYGLEDLAARSPRTVRELTDALCAIYEGPGCPLTAPGTTARKPAGGSGSRGRTEPS